jgi:hypothetical protein
MDIKEMAVIQCIDLIKKHIHPKKNDIIISGDGSFVKYIKEIRSNHIFLDSDKNYLVYEHPEIGLDVIHVIGTPSFSRNWVISIKFIKKSCSFCNTVSCILPNSFKKDSLKRAFPLNFHLICEVDLPEKSVVIGGMKHDIPCVFQIWEKQLVDRAIKPLLEPHNFEFVRRNEFPDISVRFVGMNAGSINIDVYQQNIQSHYFIKFTNREKVDSSIKALSSIVFYTDYDIGPRHLSQQDLIGEFNRCLT